MDAKLIESIDTFNVSFGGESHSVNAELFTKTMDNTIFLVKASANAIDPGCFLRLEIKANKEGSFETIIDTVAKHSPTIFAVSQLAFWVVGGFWAFLQIKDHLSGKRAKKVEERPDNKTEITNQDNAVLSVDSKIADKFFTDTHIENSIINIFTDLKENGRDSFSVKHNDKEMRFDKKEYDKMTARVVDPQNKTSRLEVQGPIQVNLLLKKPDLLGDSAWQFVYNKNISAKIEDENFLNKVHSREIKALYAGVRVPCLLQIEYELDEKFNPIPGSDKYTIKEVTGKIIEPSEQDSLF